jgi:hypothetical protein
MADINSLFERGVSSRSVGFAGNPHANAKTQESHVTSKVKSAEGLKEFMERRLDYRSASAIYVVH